MFQYVHGFNGLDSWTRQPILLSLVFRNLGFAVGLLSHAQTSVISSSVVVLCFLLLQTRKRQRMGMGQFQLQQQLSKPTPAANPCTLSPLASYGYNPMSVRTLTICHRLSVDPKLTGTLNSARSLPFLPALRPRFLCKSDNSDIIRHLELEKPEFRKKPVKQVNGVFWIILLNLGMFVADHFFQVRGVKSLYLYHNWPCWYQFVTATFCHASWEHLSSNLFFLYIFGKLVEEEEGNFALWISYIFTGVGANLVSWLVLPRNAVSVGASGAVFGLFAISVLVKITWDWRKIIEVLILGQFVIEKVMEAAQSSTALSGNFRGGYPMQSVNHIAHLSGALIGVLLVWLISKIPSPPDHEPSTRNGKSRRTP